MPNLAGFEGIIVTVICCTAVPSFLVGAAVGYVLRGRRGESKG